MERSVECVFGLRRPLAFRGAPTDGDDRGITHSIMNRRIDCVQKSLICVGSKVDGDAGSGRDAACYFYVECDFAVGATRITSGTVLAAIDGHSRNGNVVETKLSPISLQIGIVEPATELNKRDGLVCSGVGWEIVNPRELRWSIRYRLCIVRRDAMMSFGRGTLIESQHGDNAFGQCPGEMKISPPRSDNFSVFRHAAQLHVRAECSGHCGETAAQRNRARCGF